MRIIQRFGRVDRLGSKNEKIQLVNFWANMELDEYINLEKRVSGRMVMLDISATGEENVIEVDAKKEIQRYKGLGEMDAQQLWKTTLNPETRMLRLVEIEDARLANEMTELLMGSDVEPRREFIHKHGREAQLDI